MPSNKDLIANIEVEAKAKGVDVPDTKGKKNVELEQILKDLKTPPPPPAPGDAEAKAKADAEAKAKADAEAKAKAYAEAKAKADAEDDDIEPDVKAFPFSVAPGKSITTKRGILADGEEIKKGDIPDDSFKAFRKSGHIKKG